MTKTSGKRLATAERRQQIIGLRKQGKTLEAIGAEMGISAQAVHKALTNELARLDEYTTEQVSAMRALEAARLDAATLAIWPKVQDGHLGAIDRLLRIMERRSRLFGLDAPTRIAPTDPSGEKEFSGSGLAALLMAGNSSAATN